MPIVSLQPGHLPALYELYRRTTAAIPHCRFFPSETRFNEALTRPSREGTRMFVAEDSGEARGFAAVLDRGLGTDHRHEMEITALFVQDESYGQSLLDACLFAAEDAHQLSAFPAEHGHCPVPGYNAGWDGLSDGLRPVARLLARNGFTPYYRELHLECAAPHFPPASAPHPSEAPVVERRDEGKQMTFAAMVGDQEAGVCVFNTLAAISDHPDSGQWGYVDGLHVAEPFRRKGIARHLLTQTLLYLQEEGCDGCWLTTGADNWSAQPLYLAMGFEIVDASASFHRTLRPT